MKKISLEVCVCTEWVMMGSMEIIDAIEGLKSLETDLYQGLDIDVTTSSSVCAPKVSGAAPVVKINGERMEKASSAAVMARISEIANV